MKSKTLSCNLTPLKRDITRFAPAWAIYLVGLVLVMFNSLDYGNYDYRATCLPDILSGFGIVNLIYAGLCAQLLFGDLYNTKMCYSLHALPQRRESWLLSHFAAGMLFSLAPNFIATMCIMAQLGSYGYLMLYVLLAMTLQFLFFFGLAILSAMVTGNRLAMLLVYAGFNFVSVLAYWILSTIYLPMLTGVVLDTAPFYQFCPAVQLFEFDYMQFRTEHILDGDGSVKEIVYHYEGLGEGWRYLAILGVLGLVLMGIAMVLYRLRHLETAGDFVAFSKLKAPMCVVMTLCVGGVMALVGSNLFSGSMALWLAVGVILGYFGGLMLLERRLKVFRKKSIIGFAVLAAVLICSYILISADVFGIVRWVPDADQVKSVTIANFRSYNNLHDDYFYGNRISVTLEDEEEIADIIEAHEDILDRLSERADTTHRVVITYQLKSGRTVERSYYPPASGTNYQIISQYFYTPQNVLGYTDAQAFAQSMDYLSVNGSGIPPAYHAALLEALLTDCKNGFVRLSDKTTDYMGYLWLESSGYYRDLVILEGAKNTLSVLSKPEIVLGYSDWDSLLSKVEYLYLSGLDVKPAHYAGLLEAIKTDCESGSICLLNLETAFYYLDISTETNYSTLHIPRSAKATIAYIEEFILE